MLRTGRARSAFVIFFLALWIAAPTGTRAQADGHVRGVILDAQGRPLAGVTITAASARLGAAGRGAVTDARGEFRIAALPPAADYSIRAALPGYATLVVPEVEIIAGRGATLRLTLHPEGDLRTRIQVTARPQVVSLDDATTETRFSSEFLDTLPILGRNYQDILALAPGVTDVDGDGNPNIHGARDTDMITFVDGVSTTDPFTGKMGAQLNIESIQEIELKTSGATAEFGRAQGGFANVITKSGGNELEGAFKFYWRGSALDGDGAGIDDPRLHQGVGENGLRDLRFNNYLPFLSFGGPIVRDRAWFFATHESIHEEDPINALNVAFIEGVRQTRDFIKLTLQATPSHRIVFSANRDPQEYLNQGLNSFTSEESGFTLRQGGTMLTLKGTAIFSPVSALETSVSTFDGRPKLLPNLGRDTNGNGVLWSDRNGNGFRDLAERDPGEDYDEDGFFDVFEDSNRNGRLDATFGADEDQDGSGALTQPFGCEGDLREDIDCDGRLDVVPEDADGDGVLDSGEDLDGDRRLDAGTEDRNANGLLDDRSRPDSLYPYGRLAPRAPDRDYSITQSTGIVSGPYYEDFDDRRRRFTVRQDLSVFVPERRGTHDMRIGAVFERERFSRRVEAADFLWVRDLTCAVDEGDPEATPCDDAPTATIRAVVPSETESRNEGTALTGGLYFQDTWKPLANLSLGVGLRFDRERTSSFGYSPFDPAGERAPFDALNAMGGGERASGEDFLLGNNDGVISHGIWSDPLFAGFEDRAQALAPILDPLQRAALGRFTRHHTDLAFGSAQTNTLFPYLFSTGNELNLETLAAFGVVPQTPESFGLTNNNLAPRVSLSWDPVADGRTRLFATWGRYYDKLFLSSIVGEKGPDDLNRYYQYDPDGLDVIQPRFQPPLRAVPNHHVGRTISKSPPSATQVDRGLQTPFSDELTFGVEREIAPDVSLSITYISRRFRAQLQDVDLNHTLRYDDEGEALDLIGQVAFLASGTARRTSDGRPDLYVNNFFFNQVLRIGNFNEARYRAVELDLTRRLSRRWQMSASYTYSRAQGDAEDFQSRLGNDPSTIESEFGYLDFDQRHVVKVNTLMFLPRDWQAGASLNWSSGLPYSVVSRFFALDNLDMQQFRTRYGFTDVEPGVGPVFRSMNRNSERNDAVLDLNLSVRKNLVIGRTAAALTFEVFNVLNTDDLRLFTVEPNRGDLDAADANLLFGPLQLDGRRRFGRRFQIGFQFEF